LLQQEHSGGPLLVAVAGYGREKNRLRSLEVGIDFQLVKPEALHALLTTDQR
jgi:hypothetical protein